MSLFITDTQPAVVLMREVSYQPVLQLEELLPDAPQVAGGVAWLHQQAELRLDAGGGHHVLVLSHELAGVQVPPEGGVEGLVPHLQAGLVTPDGPAPDPVHVREVDVALSLHQDEVLLGELVHIEQEDTALLRQSVEQLHVIVPLHISEDKNIFSHKQEPHV